MVELGRLNLLVPVLHEASPGFFLDGGELGQILLPGRQAPRGLVKGGLIDVFVYRDSEDRLVATTARPLVSVGDFAALRVVSVNPRLGAFLDWGLDKDLLLPNREQSGPLHVGDMVVVRVRIDEVTDRIVATTRLERYLDRTEPDYEKDQRVSLLIVGETPLGYKAIIEQQHSGLIYHNDSAVKLRPGQALDGFILALRPDGKIDLTLHQRGYERIAPLSRKILERLDASGGFLPYHDKSPPAEIQTTFGVSKKAFKQGLGVLLREKRIAIEPDGIRRLKAD